MMNPGFYKKEEDDVGALGVVRGGMGGGMPSGYGAQGASMGGYGGGYGGGRGMQDPQAGSMGGSYGGGYGGGREMQVSSLGEGVYGGGGRGGRPPQLQEGKLFLGGLDNQTTRENLLEYCMNWGKISDAVVMENRGFGFVTFEDPKSAQKFLEVRDHTILSKRIEAKAAVPKNQGSSSQLTKKMFVGGTGEITDDEFRLHFDEFGEIEDAVIVRKDGVSRGFGFVTFKDEISVEKCLVQSHILPNGRRVDIKRAVPRDQMNPMMGPMPGSGGFGGNSYGGRGRGGGRMGGMGGGMESYGGMGGGGYGMGMNPYGSYGSGAGMGGYGGMGGGYGSGGGGYGGGAGGGGYGGNSGAYGRMGTGGRGYSMRYRPY